MSIPRTAATRLAMAVFACALVASGASSGARAAAPGDWELTGLGGRVTQLFTPASGAFFARTDTGLFRSDDAGTTWRPVNLPLAADAVAVGPNDHTILYAHGADGLYKSSDDAATWTLALPTPERGSSRALSIAVSPPDPDLLYLALSGPPISTDFRFLRSRNGGTTWEQLERSSNSLCGWSVLLLEPHPTDPLRLFRTAGCYAGRDTVSGDSLDQSRDAGATTPALFRPRPFFPSRLVGGAGAAPGRFYLGARLNAPPGGGRLYRSDDDGASWTEVFISPQGSSIGGLAYDPGAPDRVYIGLTSGVARLSVDGGANWSDLGRQGLGTIGDLALGIDGLNLYAATDQGLWRLRLDGPIGTPPKGQAPVQIPRR